MEGNPTKSILSRYAEGGIDARLNAGVSVLKMLICVSVTFALKIMNCGWDVSRDSSWEVQSCCRKRLCRDCKMCSCDVDADRSSPSSCCPRERRPRLSVVWSMMESSVRPLIEFSQSKVCAAVVISVIVSCESSLCWCGSVAMMDSGGALRCPSVWPAVVTDMSVVL